MKRTLSTLALLFIALCASAVIHTPKTVPLIHLEDSNRYVSNPEGILSQAVCDSIDALFRAVEDSTGVQALVAVLSDISPDDCHEFCRQLGELNGVGIEGVDNGITVVLSITERDISFNTGYGLEGVITDALCKKIQVNEMVPYFRNDDWDGGMMAGMKVLSRYLMDPELIASAKEENDGGIVALIMLILFGGPIGLGAWANYRSKKCPECGQHKLKKTGTTVLYSNAKGKKTRTTYVCANCGHELHRDSYTSYSSGSSSGGGFSGGSHSGGSFGGGSFGGGGGHYGGGHFGGGGAHTKF